MNRLPLNSYLFDDVDFDEFNELTYTLIGRSVDHGFSGRFSEVAYFFEIEPYYIGGDVTMITTDGYLRDFTLARYVAISYVEGSALYSPSFRVYLTDDPETFDDLMDRRFRGLW